MAKRLFLLFCICLTSIFATPNLLVASHDFTIKSPYMPSVKTIETPENADNTESVADTTSDSPQTATNQAPCSLRTPVASTPVNTNTTPNYTVTTYINNVNDYAKTYQNLSYSDIYRFKKLVYGHNSADLLGSLINLTTGQVFTITENGQATPYQVASIVIYNKTGSTLNNDPSLMGQIAYSAMGYDVALLTCAGEIHNGSPSQRLVVYAYAI